LDETGTDDDKQEKANQGLGNGIFLHFGHLAWVNRSSLVNVLVKLGIAVANITWERL
jgi:hypothetical protein